MPWHSVGTALGLLACLSAHDHEVLGEPGTHVDLTLDPNESGEPTPHRDDYLYITGRKFDWPAPEIGARMKVPGLLSPVPGAGEIELEVLSVSPRVYRVDNFVSDAEIEVLKRWAVDKTNPYSMRPSTVGAQSWTQKGGADSKSQSRTSENSWDVSSPVAMPIKRRSFELLRLKYNESMADGVQVLRYDHGQNYQVHTDYFGINSHTTEGSHNFDSSTPGGTNRLATIFMYLSDVEAGGQTFFPQAATTTTRSVDAELGDTAALIQDLRKHNPRAASLAEQCEAGFSVEPRKGSAILFMSQKADGSLDPRSSHAGCPVLKGQKWAANMWVWNGCRYGLSCDMPPNRPLKSYPPYFDPFLDPSQQASSPSTADAEAGTRRKKKKKKKATTVRLTEEL